MAEKEIRERDIRERAEEEANEIATCYIDFNQESDSCSICSTRGFCNRLKEYENRAEGELP